MLDSILRPQHSRLFGSGAAILHPPPHPFVASLASRILGFHPRWSVAGATMHCMPGARVAIAPGETARAKGRLFDTSGAQERLCATPSSSPICE
jgi:hypothetical protein